MISDTDFFELMKNKTSALAINFSDNGMMMAIFSRDRKIRLFNMKTGKLMKVYNESLQSYIE